MSQPEESIKDPSAPQPASQEPAPVPGQGPYSFGCILAIGAGLLLLLAPVALFVAGNFGLGVILVIAAGLVLLQGITIGLLSLLKRN